MKNFLTNFPFREFSIFVTMIVSFTYNVLLDRDVACTCTDVNGDCFKYMLLPLFIIFVIILWTDKTFKRTCKYTFPCECSGAATTADGNEETEPPTAGGNGATTGGGNEKKGKRIRTELCMGFFVRILKAGCVGALWVAFVFIEGDWYVCCRNDHSEKQSQLACKDKITAEENVIIITMKNTSKFYGFLMLLGIIVLAALMSLFDWKRCNSPCCACLKTSGCCSRRHIYDTVILEEGENVLNEILRESVKAQLFVTICENINGNKKGNGGGSGNGRGTGSGEENKWMECLDAASEMVEQKREPKLSKEQLQKLLSLQLRP